MENSTTALAAEDDDTIYELAGDCEELLLQGRDMLGTEDTKTQLLLDEYLERFTSWTDFLGVFAKRSLSLDRRLQHHAHLQDLVLRLLSILHKNLSRWVTRSTLTENAPSTSTEQAVDQTAADTYVLEGIASSIDRLHRLGVAIKQSSTRRTMDRSFNSVEDFNSFRNLALICLETLYPDTNETLREHLSISMARRYDNLASRRSRHQMLKQRRPKPKQVLLPVQEEEDMVLTDSTAQAIPRDFPARLDRHRALAERLKPTTRIAEIQSNPSSFNSQLFHQQYKEKSDVGSKKKGTSSIQLNQVGYPRPPQGYTCEWCCESLEKTSREGNEWKRHLDRDFEPFVCISDKCSQQVVSFATFQDWYHHMLNQHGSSWAQDLHPQSSWLCPVCTAHPDGFHQPQALFDHIIEVHRFEESAVKAVVQQSKFQVRRSGNLCPICCLPLEEDSDSRPNKATGVRKRQQGPKIQTGASKRAKTNLDLRESTVGQESNARADLWDNQANDDSINAYIGSPDPDNFARHVATHLQNLAILSANLISIREYGEDDRDSVTTQNPSDSDQDTGTNSTRRLKSQDNSIGEEGYLASPMSIVSSSNDGHLMVDDMPTTEDPVDWSLVNEAIEAKEQQSQPSLLGLTPYDEFDLFLLRYRYPYLSSSLQKHLARSIQFRRQRLVQHRQQIHASTRALRDCGQESAKIRREPSPQSTESSVWHIVSPERMMPEKHGSNSLKCPYCSQTLGFDERAWRRHVDEDLSPFLCLFPTCSLMLFARQSDWKAHMCNTHGENWSFDISVLLTQQSSDPDEEQFFFHANTELIKYLENRRQPGIKKPWFSGHCPICIEPDDDSDMTSHIAEHLVAIAPMCLRGIGDDEDSPPSDYYISYGLSSSRSMPTVSNFTTHFTATQSTPVNETDSTMIDNDGIANTEDAPLIEIAAEAVEEHRMLPTFDESTSLSMQALRSLDNVRGSLDTWLEAQALTAEVSSIEPAAFEQPSSPHQTSSESGTNLPSESIIEPVTFYESGVEHALILYADVRVAPAQLEYSVISEDVFESVFSEDSPPQWISDQHIVLPDLLSPEIRLNQRVTRTMEVLWYRPKNNCTYLTLFYMVPREAIDEVAWVSAADLGEGEYLATPAQPKQEEKPDAGSIVLSTAQIGMNSAVQTSGGGSRRALYVNYDSVPLQPSRSRDCTFESSGIVGYKNAGTQTDGSTWSIFGRQILPVDDREAQSWRAWEHMHNLAVARVDELRATCTIEDPRRVKIAILDSGFELDQQGLAKYNLDSPSEMVYMSWIDGDTDVPKDSSGYGTHLAVLLRRLAPHAVLHVARVFAEDFNSNSDSKDKIAQAIRHAVDVWNVDIIVMPFGFESVHSAMEDAIVHAAHSDVLLFAAAACDGELENTAISWPARCEHVICVHAGDGVGTPSGLTPKAQDGMRIMVPGEYVKSTCPPHLQLPGDEMYVSGTACAAVRATAIASLVIEFGYTSLDDYLWAKLRHAGAMKRVFKSMVTYTGHDYWWISSWGFFYQGRSTEELKRMILAALE